MIAVPVERIEDPLPCFRSGVQRIFDPLDG
jgi:hypothetical protein